MGIFRQFPYSNFHEMNMDEILKILKTLTEEWNETKTEWASYKDFIDNYFENLDVSAEVLYALRIMASSGELNTIIDPVIISETASWLAEHITITEGSTVIDDTLSIEGAAADAKATGDAINTIKNDIGVSDITFTSISGVYIGSDSVEKTGVAFSRSNPIAVSKGTVLSFTAKGYNANVAMIALSNADGTSFTAKVNSIDSNIHTYTYLVENDGYVVVSFTTANTHELILNNLFSNKSLGYRVEVIENSKAVELATEANINVIASDVLTTTGNSGHYINNTGGVSDSGNFNISSAITLLKNQSIIFTARGYSNNVAVLAKVNPDSSYTPLVVSSDNNINKWVYTANVDMSVVISSHVNATPKYTIVTSILGKLENRISGKDFVSFNTIGVIGDSLANGASNYGVDGASDRPVYSWGKYIEREHGINVNLFASGGATTRSWLIQPYGLTALNNANMLDCYIIGLGANDTYSLGSEYLGSISDVHVGNESLNADTYYGNYSKIIGAIKAKSPRAKIICLTNPRESSSLYTDFNNAIRNIVSLYTNTFLIDLVNDDFYKGSEFRDTWFGAHSTATGYKLIARNIYDHINNLIQQNISQFKDIQWIVENHD